MSPTPLGIIAAARPAAGGGGPISMVNKASNYSSTDASTYTTASFTPAANSFLVVFFGTSIASGTAPDISAMPTTLSGVTFSQIAEKWYSPLVRSIHAWGAQCGATPGTGTVQVNLAATSTSGAWAVIEVTGHNTTGTVVRAVSANDDDTGVTTSALIALGSTGAAGNRLVAAFGHRANEAMAVRTNWTELADHAGASPSSGFEVQWRSDANEANASTGWTTAAEWGGICLEIKAA